MSELPKNNWWVQGSKIILETLPDLMVLEFVITNETARNDFNKIFGYLSEERQEYLTDLVNSHPFVKNKMYVDPKTKADTLQRKQNTAGIRNQLSPRLRRMKQLREAEKNKK